MFPRNRETGSFKMDSTLSARDASEEKHSRQLEAECSAAHCEHPPFGGNISISLQAF